MTDTNVLTRLRAWLDGPGVSMPAETEELGIAIRDILASGERLTPRSLVMYFIHELELGTDGMRQETLRRVLELLVSPPPVDSGQ